MATLSQPSDLGEPFESAILTHFQVMLILLVRGLPFEKHYAKPSNRKKNK